MNRDQSHEFVQWLKTNYGSRMTAALAGTPFDVNVAYAITCQETGVYHRPLAKKLAADEALACCVFDSSGGAPGTSRSAFSKSTAAFRAQY